MGTGSACARAALAGNPSDLYGGAVVGVPLRDLVATVICDEDAPAAPHIVAAAGAPHARVETTIPRSVGLAGSSALVIATLRALGFDGDERSMAEAALRVETETLGIVAGLQDRLVQAFERPLLMDFATGTVAVLQPARPLFVFAVWDEGIAAPSGDYHARLRDRIGMLGHVMDDLAAVARDAARALAGGDVEQLGALVDRSFELRRLLGPLPDGQSELVAAVRGLGLPATSPGSGGSVAGVVDDPAKAQVLDRLGLPHVIGGI